MRITNLVLAALAAMLLSATGAIAQDKNPFVGVWERTSLTNNEGVATQPPGPPNFAIYTASGYYAQVGTVAGRKKVDKPVKDLTREELLDRFTGTTARYGTYKVAGNKLIRNEIVHTNPNLQGREWVVEFKFEKDGFVLLDPKNPKFMARWKRVK